MESGRDFYLRMGNLRRDITKTQKEVYNSNRISLEDNKLKKIYEFLEDY
jgi:hypothetical protein